MNSKPPSYHGHCFPPEIISHAVWLYQRFCLSFRDLKDLLSQRPSQFPTKPFGVSSSDLNTLAA